MRMNGRTTLDQLFWGHLAAFFPGDPKIGKICGKSGLISPIGGTMGSNDRGWRSQTARGAPSPCDGSFAPRNFTPAFDANCNFMLLYLELTVEFQFFCQLLLLPRKCLLLNCPGQWGYKVIMNECLNFYSEAFDVWRRKVDWVAWLQSLDGRIMDPNVWY